MIHASGLTEAGVPDALAGGARPVEEIADETRLDPDALGRALRTAELLGVFTRSESGWENTAVGAALRSNTDDSIREYVLYALHDGNWRAWHTSETPCAPDSRRFRRRTAASGYCVPRCRRARAFSLSRRFCPRHRRRIRRSGATSTCSLPLAGASVPSPNGGRSSTVTDSWSIGSSSSLGRMR